MPLSAAFVILYYDVECLCLDPRDPLVCKINSFSFQEEQTFIFTLTY